MNKLERRSYEFEIRAEQSERGNIIRPYTKRRF